MHPPINEPRWAGAREVLVMAGPIVLSMISYTVMETMDQVMAAQLGTAELAAMGTAPVFTYLIAATMLGIVTCVSTFVSQSIGRGHPEHGASYTWQGVHFGVLAGVFSLAAWPLALPLFSAMGHTPQVAGLEAEYFQVRLLGFMPLVWIWAFMTFFMAIERPNVPMYIAIVGNLVNFVLNYMLIFGEWGAPQLGVAGAAWGTVASQWLQAGLFFWVFLSGKTNARFATRAAWPLHGKRLRELLRIGVPNGLFFLMDVMTWAVFIGVVVGGFGDVALAANGVAVAIMKLSFMPAVAVNQAIGPIVGNYLGQGDIARAKARTWTAVRLTIAYMGVLGIFMGLFGDRVTAFVFTDDPEVVGLAHRLLIVAAVFQAFDALNIVVTGALRGTGDTRWMTVTTFIAAYPVFLPLAFAISWGLNGGAVGAWIAAAVYILGLSLIMSWRFRAERWRSIHIFSETAAETQPAPAAIRPESGVVPVAGAEQAAPAGK